MTVKSQWKQPLPNQLELTNASIAFVDEDQSTLSKRLFESFYPPRLKHPQAIKADEADRLMDNGSFMFVVVVPPTSKPTSARDAVPSCRSTSTRPPCSRRASAPVTSGISSLIKS
jgi:hypothetical protein